ncbi:MAG: NAD(P)-dependent oxidoreductase [Bryobacteraceae bacterium]|jgi:3-hydroxyisobutyrate dehydrogenase/2-hydroxy-3-oxopropionate reductase
MTLGFLGLGIMGYPMARNLLRAGHSLAVWSNTAAKARRLAEAEKAEFCATPKQVAEAAEIVFLCVGDTAMSERVTLGPDGILDGVRAGSIVADCSTVAPSYARRAAAALAEKGAHFLDTPVTGSKPGAEGGTLTIMVGGDAAIYEKLKPYLEPMGKQVYYCGGIGLGLHAKLTQNLILSNLLQAFNEGLVLATRAGVDPELMIEILNNSAARSGMISFKAPYVLRRDFSTNFSTRWMHKDIGLMLETGAELGVPLPLTGLTRQLVQVAISEGYADEDMCSTIKVLEKIAGVEVKSISKKS